MRHFSIQNFLRFVLKHWSETQFLVSWTLILLRIKFFGLPVFQVFVMTEELYQTNKF